MKIIEGWWPERCVQRAFVEGVRWWHFYRNGSTIFPSERDEAQVEAVKRYGEPIREEAMITIRKSPTADTRTCDFANTTKETLLASSHQHIADVRSALDFMIEKIEEAKQVHDHDKISDIDGFHQDFLTGFKKTDWWDKHRKVNRHHLLKEDGVPQNVNLIDVLDMICDCVMAGMARSGSVYPLNIEGDVLHRAFDNTVELLKANVVVEEPK